MAGLLSRLGVFGDDVISTLLPRTCHVCGISLVGDERVMCAHCDADLPRTRWHLDDFNDIHKRIMGHARISRAAAFFHYSGDSRYADLIRIAKYHGCPSALRCLGARYAAEIAPDGFFDGIDVIEPVPMSPLKRLVRGYNQTESLAMGISSVTGIDVGDHLRARLRRAQAGSHALRRFANVKGKFALCHCDELRGRHILLVDDVITTGATMHAIAELIHSALDPDYTLSVLALGVTSRY